MGAENTTVDKELQPLLHPSVNTGKSHDAALTIDDIAIATAIAQSEEPTPNATVELRKLLAIAYPVVLTTSFEYLPGFTSIILAGHIDSPFTKEYVDAATLSTMFTNITALSVGFGLTTAMDTLCSQAYGAKRYDKIGIYFQSGVLVLGACLIPIFILNWFSETFLLFLGQNHHVAELAQDFSRAYLFGVPFIFLYELFRKALQAQNVTKPFVVISVLGNVVNIGVGYGLAYHTSLGFQGVAIARSFANVLLPLLLIPYFWWKPSRLRQWWRHGWQLKEAYAHVGLFLRLGIPGFLMVAMEWWAYEMLSLFAGWLPNSVVALSAHAVLCNTTSMLFMVYSGISSAANICVGNCLGANQPKKAQLVGQLAIGFTAGVGFLLATVLFFGCDYIPRLFISDPTDIAVASHVLLLWTPMEILDGMNCVIQGIFRGAGEQHAAATTNAVAYYIGGIPMAALLGFLFHVGVEGLWLGLGFGICLSLGMLLFLIRRWNWGELAEDALNRTAE